MKFKFKERYNFKCIKCGYELWAKPSICMTGFGMNSGHGSCLRCGEFLHLRIKGGLKGKTMISERWDDFLKKQPKRMQKEISKKVADEVDKQIMEKLK